MQNTRKRIPATFLALVLVLSMAASASARYVSTTKCKPQLSFSGTTATCTLTVTALKGASITGTLTLYRGNTEVESWDINGTTRVNFSDTATVKSGYTYKLVADLTVSGSNGTDHPYETVSKAYR